ncbi:MAG TPA: glycosyltransferase family 39 protein [Verrucomicrobiae bacterium]|nr:glycosyltransferase family 39 protein [Verrucomicrobiae bacterium]
MQTASDRGASTWLRPEFARLLAILWVVGLALVYLVRYQGWAVLPQLGDTVGASIPVLHAGPHFREFWTARMYDFGCVVAIMATALGLGATVAGRLIARRDILGMLFALAAGLWLLAALTLIIGAAYTDKAPVENVRFLFLMLVCWFSPAPWKFVGDFHVSTERIDGWAKLMFACILLAATLNLAGALTPPFEYDELEYHLGALADYQRAGRIVFLPHNFYSNMPQLTEMLYLLAKTTTSDVAAKLLHWLFGLLTAAAVYGVAQRLWSRGVGLTAAALFYCTPFVQDLGQTARIDLATAFYATLAFGALVLWMEDDEKRDLLWLSALGAGGAVATKWPAVAVVLIPVAAALVCRRKLRLLARYCLVVCAMAAPWLVKNWLLTGNPVYPLFYSWFPNPHWSSAQALVFSERHAPSFGWTGWADFFRLVWTYSFVEPGAVPLLLMTTPLLLLVRRVESGARRAGWLFVGAYLGWFCCTFRPWRFLFPSFGMAAIVAAFAMERLGRDAKVRVAMRCSVGLVMAASIASLALNDLIDAGDPTQTPPQISFAQYALGQFSRSEFIEQVGRGVLEPIVWMNENLPANAKVLYVGEARAYYATRAVVYSTAFDENPLTALSQAATTPEELIAALRARGITHVYVNFSELNRLQKGYHYMANANWTLIRSALDEERLAKVIHAFNGKVVYELEK